MRTAAAEKKQTTPAHRTVVKDAKTLNTALIELYNGVNEGRIMLPLAKELFNGSGKIIKLNLGRLEAKKLTKHTKKIDFWEE